MKKADRLSRRPDLKVGVENNNENQKLIKKEWIREIMEVVVKELEITWVEKIQKAREKDEEVVKVVKEKSRSENIKRWWVGDKRRFSVKRKKDVYTKGWEAEIRSLYHNIPVAGHGGRWKITELVMRNY